MTRARTTAAAGTPTVTVAVPLMLVLLLVGATLPSAQACRCASRSLAEHFADADVVMLATLDAIAPLTNQDEVGLTLQPSAVPWKGDPRHLEFVTGASSASCGLPPLVGRRYLVFGQIDPQTPGIARVDTCSGSRMFDPGGGALQGFADVPAARVPGQLAMLQAMDTLSALMATAGAPKLRGLLDLKPLAHGGYVTLRDGPSVQASVLRRVESMDELPQREATYEFPAAIVMDRRDGWYAIRVDAADEAALGWVAAEQAGTWWPLEKLLVGRLTYLTDAWDGLLWPDAAGAGRVLRLEREAERPVEVIGTAEFGGSLWLRLRILGASPCEGGEPGATHGGWIPAWSVAGQPNAWFHSRGC